jgi:hypothetical protein
VKFQVLEKKLRRIKRMELEKGNIHQRGVFRGCEGGGSGDEEKDKSQ